MSKVIDVSSKLGDYMLKGWVLTDKICSTPNCNVPLMRSPNGQTPVVHYCANCNVSSTSPSAPVASTSASSPTASSEHYSRPSTPLTEMSSGLSSPTFAPPIETTESRRRREQSDRASSEIGKKLLQGWAMLADECPNSRCFGIPLVRPPSKPGAAKDPTKHCVICERVYVDERDAAGWERLVPVESSESQTVSASPITAATALESSTRSKSKAPTGLMAQPLEETTPRGQREITSTHAALNMSPMTGPRTMTTSSACEASANSLERSLHILSDRLDAITGNPATMDVNAVGTIADSMSRVAQALSQIRQLNGSA